MNHTHLSSNELKAIREFKKKVARDYPVVNFKLFGSKARGDFSRDSDIDLLLVLKRVSESGKDKIYNLVNDILLRTGIDLSVKIFPKKEYDYLNKIPSVFMQFIQKEGISL